MALRPLRYTASSSSVSSGSLIYRNPYFQKAENVYHVPQSVVDICDAIEVPGREVMAVFPGELLQYVRQYSNLVCMPYGRNIVVSKWTVQNDLYDVMEQETIDAGELATLAREEQCAYIILPETKYDLAGFAVGVVERKDLITGENIKPGDVLVGIASSGVHSNGFSLVRKVFDMTKESLDTYYDELGKTLGEALLAPTRIYVKAMKSVKNAGVKVKGCSHITGGGFYENIPRMLPDGIRAVVKKDSYEVPAIFRLMQKKP